MMHTREITIYELYMNGFQNSHKMAIKKETEEERALRKKRERGEETPKDNRVRNSASTESAYVKIEDGALDSTVGSGNKCCIRGCKDDRQKTLCSGVSKSGFCTRPYIDEGSCTKVLCNQHASSRRRAVKFSSAFGTSSTTLTSLFCDDCHAMNTKHAWNYWISDLLCTLSLAGICSLLIAIFKH
jgi:hypothetical protein